MAVPFGAEVQKLLLAASTGLNHHLLPRSVRLAGRITLHAALVGHYFFFEGLLEGFIGLLE